jgi:hypothetical protein
MALIVAGLKGRGAIALWYLLAMTCPVRELGADLA